LLVQLAKGGETSPRKAGSGNGNGKNAGYRGERSARGDRQQIVDLLSGFGDQREVHR
jgi:hypothetical protein